MQQSKVESMTRSERFLAAIRQDIGCLSIATAFIIIMVFAIVFANIITPSANNPFV